MVERLQVGDDALNINARENRGLLVWHELAWGGEEAVPAPIHLRLDLGLAPVLHELDALINLGGCRNVDDISTGRNVIPCAFIHP